MIHKQKDVLRANAFFIFLKKQSKKYLNENNISKCKECKGFGILVSGEFPSWDGISYCDECEGVGFKGEIIKEGLQVDQTHYLCRKCNGGGCEECKYKGIVNWIDHLMGR